MTDSTGFPAGTLILVLILQGLLCGAVALTIADRRGITRNGLDKLTYFLVGLLFSVLGVVLAAFYRPPGPHNSGISS